MVKSRGKRLAMEYGVEALIILLGAFIFSVSINCFTDPNDISPGGVIGIAQLLHDTNGFNVVWTGWIINIPIFIWAIVEFDWHRLIKNAFATFSLYPMIDFTREVLKLPAYTGDPMLVALLAGVSGGIGLALIFMRGAATGGTDLLASLTKLHIPYMPVGKILFFIDSLVVGVSAVVYGFMKDNPYAILEGASYAAVLIFVQSKLIDAILYGTSVGSGKFMLITSAASRGIAKQMTKEFGREVTLLKAQGVCNEKDSEVLLTAVRNHEVHKAYMIIKAIDEKAFVIVGESGEITGYGFKTLDVDIKKLKK